MEESLIPDLAGFLGERFSLPAQDIKSYSPLTLAFIGDSVFEVVIRSILVRRGQKPVKALNREKVRFVSAKAQAGLVTRMEPLLTDEEKDIIRRGKGTKTAHHAKNASLQDYHLATGFEALCGYLYLTGRLDRLTELLALTLEKDSEDET